MALTYQKVKDIILDELRAKGYSPNPADVHLAATKIMDAYDNDTLEDIRPLAAAGAPLISLPPKA